MGYGIPFTNLIFRANCSAKFCVDLRNFVKFRMPSIWHFFVELRVGRGGGAMALTNCHRFCSLSNSVQKKNILSLEVSRNPLSCTGFFREDICDKLLFLLSCSNYIQSCSLTNTQSQNLSWYLSLFNKITEN